jgi:hypothetical protein
MDYNKIRQSIKRSPALLAGVALGGVIVYGMSRFPVLVEVNWGVEERQFIFDNRTEHWCAVAKTVTE